MKIIIFILCVAMTLISCASSQLQIGSTLPSTAKKLNQGLLISAASIRDESYTLNEKGIEYIICLNAGKKIEYICTEDKKFVSPEGLKIGDTLKRALTATPDNLIIERGWAYYVKLPSGWNASFTQGWTMTEAKLKDDAKIKWFFKRK